MAIRCDQALADVISSGGRRILWRSAGRDTVRQDFNTGVGIGIEEEGGGIAIADRDCDTMGRGDVDIVGPAHHTVADIADEGSWDVRRVNPGAVSRTNLKSSNTVRGEDCEIAVVGVSARAAIGGAGCAPWLR